MQELAVLQRFPSFWNLWLFEVFYFVEADLWKAIRWFQRKTALGQKVYARELLHCLSSQPHHLFSFPSLRTVSTGAKFRPIIFADLVNMSCYQWCGLTWLLKEMVKWVVFGSAWRASWQWALQGAVRIPPPGNTQTPKHCRNGDVSHICWYWGLCRMALMSEVLWDRDNFFYLLCLLTAWHHDCSWPGLLDHKQIHTNSSGQLRNQVPSQSRKWNIYAVVNSPHSVPHTALEMMQFAICLQKYNWISLLLCYHYSISWYWLCINWQYHQNPGGRLHTPLKQNVPNQARRTKWGLLTRVGIRGRLRLTGK